jgi:hypothetical protein
MLGVPAYRLRMQVHPWARPLASKDWMPDGYAIAQAGLAG